MAAAELFDVELRGVTKRYGAVPAVTAIDLAVEHGRFYSLLGPSGCGKTTTLRLIAGFEHPDEGQVLIAGTDVTGLPAYRRDVHTVFQHYALFPHMTVAENVAFGLEQRRVAGQEARKRAQEALELVQLQSYGNRRPHELSGGQQQRVALARSLVDRPAVLLLDEPLGALDLKLRKEMQFELKRLQQQVRITFVYVTHDQEEALTMSDRMAVMFGGAILQEGAPKEIYEHPNSRFVADFIGLSNFIDGEVVDVETGQLLVEGGGIRIWCKSDDAFPKGTRVVVAVRPEKIAISNAAPSSEATVRNNFGGRMVSGVFLGDQTEYRVRLDMGQELVVRRQNLGGNGAAASLGLGSEVHVSWEPEVSLVLPARGGRDS